MTKSKQRILKVASDLFSEFGFLGVSMEDIAKRLNITKAALYYHFRNKKQLYLEVLEKSFQSLIEIINRQTFNAKSPEQTISQLVKSYLKFGTKEKNLINYLVLKTPKQDSEIANYIVKLRTKIDYQFQTFLRGIFAKNNLKITTSFLLGTMDRLILEADLLNKRLNIKKSSLQILRIIKPLFRGITTMKIRNSLKKIGKRNKRSKPDNFNSLKKPWNLFT